jgi:hypothetical protein
MGIGFYHSEGARRADEAIQESELLITDYFVVL